MKEIIITDFVSNNAEANEIITTFNNNKLVIKGDTGIGGTTSILDIIDKNVIIISPLTGMIKGKENKRSNHQMFIYKNSTDRWKDYEFELNSNANIIMNTTPEQILEIKKLNNFLFNKIMDIPFFVDEFQVYSESQYRSKLNDFYNILFKEHKACKTLSTATPTYKNLDIPKDILNNMEIIKIKRKEQREKPISIEPISNYYNFIKSNCNKGNKVVFFTNELKKISNILNSEDFGYKIQTLVGDNLSTKLSQFSPKTSDEKYFIEHAEIDAEANLYILSTKYLIGFDLEFDAAIGIIMDEGSKVNNYNVNQFIQAYGRVRKQVIEAGIFYNSNSSDIENIDSLEKIINDVKYDSDYLINIQPHLNQINNSLTYPREKLIHSLKTYGFNPIVNDEVFTIKNISTTFPEKYRNLVNQENGISSILKKELKHILNNIKGDDKEYNGFGEKYLLLWAAAYIAIETKSTYLRNYEAERYERLLLRVKTFIDVNELAYPHGMTDLDKITKYRVSSHMQDLAIKEGAVCAVIEELKIFDAESNSIIINQNTVFTIASNRYYDDAFSKAKMIINSLYVIHLIQNSKYLPSIERIINGFDVVSKCLVEDYIKALETTSKIDINKLLEDDNKEKLDEIYNEYANELKSSDVFKNSNRKISNNLKKLNSYESFEKDEIKLILEKAENIKSSLIDCKHGILNTINKNTYNIKKQVERHKYYILSLLSMSCAGHIFGFKSTTKDNRVFNPATKTAKQLRSYTPYEMIQCDITSAFPTFLDKMIGSNIASQVYENIMKNRNIDRGQAKKLYNSMLNDYKINKKLAKDFFSICGYTQEQIEKILEITSQGKGVVYRRMTVLEEESINLFIDTNNLKNVAMRLHDALYIPNIPDYQKLFTKFGNIEFEITVL